LDERHRREISPERRSDEIIIRAFAKLDRSAFGVALGVVTGVLVFAATLFGVVNGSAADELKIFLLSQYYPGYRVTPGGAILGLLYGFVSGFLIGWCIAHLRNASLGIYLRFVRKKTELSRLHDFLDRV
jgi:hypothetical protein